MLGYLGFQRPLDDQLGQVLKEPILANQVFGFLVIGQQTGQQFFRYAVFLLAHCNSGQVGSLLPKVRLHKILHTLELALARLAGVSGLVPSVKWLLYSAIRKEALLTGTGGEGAIHMVSAFATELGLVLGQEKVDAMGC